MRGWNVFLYDTLDPLRRANQVLFQQWQEVTASLYARLALEFRVRVNGEILVLLCPIRVACSGC